jgi:hypothetical protein
VASGEKNGYLVGKWWQDAVVEVLRWAQDDMPLVLRLLRQDGAGGKRQQAAALQRLQAEEVAEESEESSGAEARLILYDLRGG